MGGSSTPTDLNPWSPYITGSLIPSMGRYDVGSAGNPYPGVLAAGASPMQQWATQMGARRGMSGGPQAWSQAQNYMQMGANPYSYNPHQSGVDSFIGTYLNAYPTGWNPYSGQQQGQSGVPQQGGGRGGYGGGGQYRG